MREHLSQTSSSSDEESSSPVASPVSATVDRGRSRIRRPSNQLAEHNLRKRGYHSFMSSFGKMFHVEKRWKLVREMGSGAYGVVVHVSSAADEISGQTVAIKLVTRVFEKLQLAKRALREIVLLRHFSNHENITGLIDVDAISPDFQEIYIFMEPMEADLHQIIKSGQQLTNEHVQYFLYQILRGMKYVHSACVIHRDLKPGNLLVNSDCELKICDFGLSRGFDASPDERVGHLTEYVATRWYRAPEIMLAFRGYDTAIDVWSIGCIFAELLQGRPMFKGRDYVDQLNKILEVLGTPEESVIHRIGSDKAQAYVRSLPYKKAVPLRRLLPAADFQALDLLSKMLSFDPVTRITISEALAHPWLASYHDEADEPVCTTKFEKWKEIEKLETLEEFREALWNEIEDYRMEVRGIRRVSGGEKRVEASPIQSPTPSVKSPISRESNITGISAPPRVESPEGLTEQNGVTDTLMPSTAQEFLRPTTPTDPVVTYARRSSILQPTRQTSTSAYNSPLGSISHQLSQSIEGLPTSNNGSAGGIAFPTQSYVVPARSRAPSTTGGDMTMRKLLRTLSTVSIHESVEGLPGGLAGVAPIGKYIVDTESGADAPPSEMPGEFGIEEGSEGESRSGGRA
ncbi:Pkinase-domain-containing protein [Leucogyrophana mollusca]|uniref:Pkinase-domain-containing protein n=1 Tax=Leucogyrophana mollusca TaxID=85980 RepID=A0ACB8BT99_9AGAM|nr:Pkinase-domain-containing protein [Leucogyrophana mollusca]